MNIFFRPIISYIDPGTGALLFALFMGLTGAVRYFFESLWIKVKFVISGGVDKSLSSEKKPLVIFSDDKRYWNVFAPICNELEERQLNAEYWTLSPDDPGLSENYKYVKAKFIGSGNKGYAVLNNMKAKACLSTTPGLDVYQWKRSRDVDQYIHIYHDVTEGMRYRMFGLDYYDTVLLNAKFQERYIRILEDKRGIKKKECRVCGSVYLDDLVKQSKEYSNYLSDEKLTILMAPSWGPNSLLARFGSKLIDALISTGFHIIIRPHPQSFISEKELIDPLLKKYSNIKNLEWDTSVSNISSLCRANVLVSDFSGIVLDYVLVFDGPVIVADSEFDPAMYDASWIDEPLWMDQIVDKIGIKLSQDQFENIKFTITQLINSTELKETRKQISDEIWNNQGMAVKSVVDYLESIL